MASNHRFNVAEVQFGDRNRAFQNVGPIHAENISIGVLRPSLAEECLQSLSFTGMLARCSDKTREEGSCEWIRHHPAFESWRADGGFIWLRGCGGCGKSMLMDYLVDNAVNDSSTSCLWFAFSRTIGGLKSSSLGMMRAMLHQLLSRGANECSSFVAETKFEERCKQHGRPGERWSWDSHDLEKSMRLLLKEVANSQPIRIYLDGLDEIGEDEAVWCIRFLRSMTHESPSQFSVCFSSRYMELRSNLYDSCIQIEKDNGPAAEVLLSKTFAQFDGSADTEMIENIKATLEKQTEGVLLWLVWALKRAERLIDRQESFNRVARALKNVPEGLTRVYEQALDRIAPDDVEEAMTMFEWACLTSGHTSLEELRVAVCLKDLARMKGSAAVKRSDYWCKTNSVFEKRLDSISRGLLRAVYISGDFKKNDPGFVRSSTVDRFGRPMLRAIRIIHCDHETVKEFMIEQGIDFLHNRLNHSTVCRSKGAMHLSVAIDCFNYLVSGEVTEHIDRLPLEGGVLAWPEDDEPDFLLPSFARTASDTFVAQLALAKLHGSDADALSMIRFLAGITSNQWRYIGKVQQIYAAGIKYQQSRYRPIFRWPRYSNVWHFFCDQNLTSIVRWCFSTIDTRGLGHLDLLQIAASLDEPNDGGQTALMLAATKDNLELVDTLLCRGADVHAIDQDGCTSLHWALLEYEDLFDASQAVQVAIRLLQEPEIDVDLENDDGLSSMFLAAPYLPLDKFYGDLSKSIFARSKLGPHCRMLTIDTSRGLKNPMNRRRQTWPEQDTGKLDETDIPWDLQRADANREMRYSRDDDGYFQITPLLSAATNIAGSEVFQSLLRDPRFDPDAADQYGNTFFHSLYGSELYGLEDVEGLRTRSGRLKFPLDTRNAFGNTPLQKAVRLNYFGLVEFLIESRKVAFNNINNEGFTPIMEAIRGARGQMTDLLLNVCENKIDVWRITSSGMNAVMLARDAKTRTKQRERIFDRICEYAYEQSCRPTPTSGQERVDQINIEEIVSRDNLSDGKPSQEQMSVNKHGFSDDLRDACSIS